VFDPVCGIGTALVETVHQGRDAIGVEYEPGWADLARGNLELAKRSGATRRGQVICGDARHVNALLDPDARGLVALVVTSPPYGVADLGSSPVSISETPQCRPGVEWF